MTDQEEEITITVRLTPKAAKNAIQGWADGPDGEKILKACVTTVPENGKANKALIALLSKNFKTPKSNILIIKGETSRLKTIRISSSINLFTILP